MRTSIKDYARLVATTLPIAEPVYEFGALQVAGQEGFADLRPLFPGKTYVGCDMRPGPGVDRLLDLHALDLPDATAGTILCFDTLEHVEYPHRAVEEMFRVLRPGGVLAITSVMDFHIHDHPHDYWRFTPDAFRSLLRPCAQVQVDWAGREIFPHTVVGLGVKGATLDLAAYTREIAAWQRRWWNPKGRSWQTAIHQLTPPLLLDLYRRLQRG
ncbi:MAG TPA: methyltransferase type 11 [Acidobacteria bacterium]|nr:methyltransferase type 11 [Acidobacteriota bacterium]